MYCPELLRTKLSNQTSFTTVLITPRISPTYYLQWRHEGKYIASFWSRRWGIPSAGRSHEHWANAFKLFCSTCSRWQHVLEMTRCVGFVCNGVISVPGLVLVLCEGLTAVLYPGQDMAHIRSPLLRTVYSRMMDDQRQRNADHSYVSNLWIEEIDLTKIIIRNIQ